MNDTIAGFNIGSDNVDSLTIVCNLNSTFSSFDKANSLTSKGLNISSGNISSIDWGTSDNMSGNNGFGLFRGQALKGTFWKLSKSIIRWSKNGDSLNSLQSFNKTKITDNFYQSGKSTCSNSNIYNVSNIGSSCDRSRRCWSWFRCS